MNCKKCGNPLDENDEFCSVCGRARSAGRRAVKRFKSFMLMLVALVLIILSLFAGMEIGRDYKSSLPEAPDFISSIAEALKNIAAFPFEAEITQDKLTETVKKNEEKLLPLENAKLTLTKDCTAVLTGTVPKASLTALMGEDFPSYISVFLPDTISVYIEASFPGEENGGASFKTEIKNVTLAGITLSDQLTDALDVESIATNIVEKLLESAKSPYYEFTGLQIRKSTSSENIVIVLEGTAKLT